MSGDIDIVAGAGIWGCTIARRLADAGRKVLLIDSRPFIGGNCRCYYDDNGIEVHKYGSHIFHTSNRKVYDFIRRFTDFNSFHMKFVSVHRGKRYLFPVSIPLLEKFFGVEISTDDARAILEDESKMNEIYDAFFKCYIEKQWGPYSKNLDNGVLKRVPIRANYDIGSYSDIWQGIPLDGYEKMFDKMLSHPNITVELSTEFALSDKSFRDCRVFYSGAVDCLMNYSLGPLPYRSLEFEFETLDVSDYQGNAIVSFPDSDVQYTRIHEFKHFHYEDNSSMDAKRTVIAREYPIDWKIGLEPYYPVKTDESIALYSEYLKKLSLERKNMIVGGRLGNYMYLDMDDAMANAIEIRI